MRFSRQRAKEKKLLWAAKMIKPSFEGEVVKYEKISSSTWAWEGFTSKIIKSERPGDFKPAIRTIDLNQSPLCLPITANITDCRPSR